MIIMARAEVNWGMRVPRQYRYVFFEVSDFPIDRIARRELSYKLIEGADRTEPSIMALIRELIIMKDGSPPENLEAWPIQVLPGRVNV